MHPLDGPRLKIVRAKHEISQLNLMERAFVKNTKFYVVKSEFNPKSLKYVYRVRVEGSPPPLEWGVYIGEIAHNFRSALNHLVYQLALLQNDSKTVERDRSLQFPIFLPNRDSDKEPSFTAINLLRPEHQARIKQLEPSDSTNRL